MSGRRTVAELRALLEQAVLDVQNLTKLLDESPGAEQEEVIVRDLQEARARVISLERELQEAEAAG